MTSRLYRYSLDRDSGAWGWGPYRSLPERNLDGQMVFNLLDPQGVYFYFARLIGFAYNKLSYDTSVIADQFDAADASHFFLPYLGQQYGLNLVSSETLLVQRSKVANAVQTSKKKGSSEGVSLRLRDFGYIGYAYEVFVNSGDAMAQLINNVNGAVGNVPILAASTIGALTVYGMSGGSAVTPASGVVDFESHQFPNVGDTLIIGDGSTKKTFYFTLSSAPGGTIAVMIGATQSLTMDNLVTAINANLAITATNITKVKVAGPPINDLAASSSVFGTRIPANAADFREYPHGYFNAIQPIYSMSSRVAVHINNQDNTPLSYPDTPQGIAAAEAVKKQIGSDLSFDVLPAHVDVMYFATDFNVMGPGVKEGVAVSETFSVTHV